MQGAPMLTRLVDAGTAQAAQAAFLRELLPDALGFAGAVMTRRIVGIAHVADMEGIADPDARCGRRQGQRLQARVRKCCRAG